MWFGIYLFGLVTLSEFPPSSSENEPATCVFHYWHVNWQMANRACRKERKQLLCYKSKKEIDDLTEAFKLGYNEDAELELWLSNRNCSTYNKSEECLSLHIQKSMKGTWHYFQTDCHRKFQFACCLKEGETTTSLLPSTIKWEKSTGDPNFSNETTVEVSTLTPHCKGFKKRGVFWPDSNLGEVVVMPCPGNSLGTAIWRCDKLENGEWEDNGPDMRNCRSLDIANIREKFNTSSVSETVSLMRNFFEDPDKEIFSEDLVDVISLMKFLPDRLFSELQIHSTEDKWSSTIGVVATSTLIVDRIIDLQNTWTDLPKERKPLLGTELVSTVENFALLLADSMTDNIEEQSFEGKNIAVQIKRATYGESMKLPQWVDTDMNNRKGNIMIDQGYDKDMNSLNGNISVVFTMYSNLSQVLEPLGSQKNMLVSSSLNSAVLSATVTQSRKVASISSKVRILVEHFNPNPNDTACVFWNTNRNQWDTDGCQLETSNDTYSLCVCDHLTNFAVLMDYKGVLDDVDTRPFHYITAIGCSLSIICLAICIIVFTCYSYHSKHAWGLRYVIHRNLCITLLIANLVLVLGLDRTDNERLCTIIAGMLHYFFLSAFSWMLLEGVHIYMLLVVVFASRRSHWEKYYLFGYGFPLIIVAITAISRPTYYGTDEICWLSIEKGTIWAFMGPVACILIVNTAALLLAQYKASNISIKDDNMALVKRWLRITFILFPVLGVTWIFGFMYVGKRFLAIGYLFAILNSLQGFCIFVCHCLMDKKARGMLLASFKKKSSLIHTGSTGVQKKQQNGMKEEVKVSNLEQNGFSNPVHDLNEPLSFRGKWRKWRKWRMPWSFCFEMPVSEITSSSHQMHIEMIPKPIILQWNNLGGDRTS